jgi:hypothetical protein
MARSSIRLHEAQEPHGIASLEEQRRLRQSTSAVASLPTPAGP